MLYTLLDIYILWECHTLELGPAGIQTSIKTHAHKILKNKMFYFILEGISFELYSAFKSSLQEATH